jgi:hypothetical protein
LSSVDDWVAGVHGHRRREMARLLRWSGRFVTRLLLRLLRGLIGIVLLLSRGWALLV